MPQGRHPNKSGEQVTRLLDAAASGEAKASDALLPLVYDELRKLAVHRMTSERADHTLQATALVHEAYLRLVGDRDIQWANRVHFFHAAAEAMRRILIEHARAKGGPKRGGGRKKLPLDVVDLAVEADPVQIMALDEAISRLEQEDADAARVVRLRFYAGLSVEEVAKAVGGFAADGESATGRKRAFLIQVLGST